jgi:hypothetical protein
MRLLLRLIVLPFAIWATLDLLDRLFLWRFHPPYRRP